MGIAMMVVGIITTAFILTMITTVALRMITEVIRLFLVSRGICKNPSYQSTTRKNGLTYRVILIGGINCLYSFINYWVIGFRDLVTYVDKVANPQGNESKHKAKKQLRDISHIGIIKR